MCGRCPEQNRAEENGGPAMTSFRDRYGRYALVTGASAGIGEEFARQLAGRGLNLVLVARRQDKLDELAAALTASAGVEVRTVALDLLAEDAVTVLLDSTESVDLGLVVLNAGLLSLGPFLDRPLDEHADLLKLNAVVPMRLSHVFGNRLKRRGHGGLVLVASIVGEHPTPYEANYSASKAYLSTLGQALHVELAPAGVDVTVLAPGLVDTPMTRNAPGEVTTGRLPISGPGPVVRAALDGLGRRALVIPGALNKVIDVALRLAPRSVGVRTLGSMLGRMLATAAPAATPVSEPEPPRPDPRQR
jgi:short-subunit dehydrogenase